MSNSTSVPICRQCIRTLLPIAFVFVFCIVLLEFRFFSIAPSITPQTRQGSIPSISVVLSSEDETVGVNRKLVSKSHDGSSSEMDGILNDHHRYDPQYDASLDWFNATAWHSHSQINFSCPVFENVCVHHQHFWVHSKTDEFDLDWKTKIDLLGTNMPNLRQSIPVYKRFFHSTQWEQGQYESSHCIYHPVYNHLILEASYQTMLGEFYARTLRFLHLLNDEMGFITDEIQFWLLLGDQQPLYVSHYLFTERFSRYNLEHFTTMMDHVECHCYHRILFCGFQKKGHEIPWPRKDRNGKLHLGNDILQNANQSINDTDAAPSNTSNLSNNTNPTFLMPLKTLVSRMEPEEARDLFPKMITSYNQWVDTMDPDLDHDIRAWKYEQMITYFVDDADHAQNDVFAANPIDADTLMHEIDEWRFIGLYDRRVRRSWLQIEEDRLKCNERYFEHKMFCHIIVLEDFLHSRDVIIIHRASFMLIGVHGAQLTDAIWMKYDEKEEHNNFIIELLPYGGPKYTSALDKPTALGVIFWKSHFNHVGLRLDEKSPQNPRRRWDENDFYVEWSRLSKVIDFLLIDDGGMCTKFGRADNLTIPEEIDQFGFAVYNAYCIKEPLVWHGVKPPRLY